MGKLAALALLCVLSLSAQYQPPGGGGGGSTSPGSPANSVQFNNAGAFGGDANFVYIPAAGGNPPQFAIGGHIADFTGSNSSNIGNTPSADFYWGSTIPVTDGISVLPAYAEQGYYFWNPNTAALQDTFYTGSKIVYDIPGTGITDQVFYIESVPDYQSELAVRKHLLTIRSASQFCWNSIDNAGGTPNEAVPIPDTCIQRPAAGVVEIDSGTEGSGGALKIPALKSTTGTRFVCVDTAGNITSSVTACSGT